MRLSPPSTHFTAELTEAMQIKCFTQGHNILMPGFELSTSESRNQNSNHTTIMLHLYIVVNVVQIKNFEHVLPIVSLMSIHLVHITFSMLKIFCILSVFLTF